MLLADGEPGGVALGKRGIEPGEAEHPVGLGLVAGELRRECDVARNGPFEQGRELRHQADLASQVEHLVLGRRRGRDS